MTARAEPWPAGTPCWVDYGAVDVDAAARCYSEVLGWTSETAGPEYGGYLMCKVGEQDAAGIGPATAPGAPPAWVTYLSSTDADATAAAALEAGGKFLAEPFDVMDLGRMSVLADPQGAMFGVWQAGSHIGCSVYNEPGALVWNEAAHPDPEAGQAFYARVFGYTFDDVAGAGKGYRSFRTDGDSLGGMGGLADAGEPVDSEYGRMATLTDPWGAVFAVMGGGTAA